MNNEENLLEYLLNAGFASFLGNIRNTVSLTNELYKSVGLGVRMFAIVQAGVFRDHVVWENNTYNLFLDEKQYEKIKEAYYRCADSFWVNDFGFEFHGVNDTIDIDDNCRELLLKIKKSYNELCNSLNLVKIMFSDADFAVEAEGNINIDDERRLHVVTVRYKIYLYMDKEKVDFNKSIIGKRIIVLPDGELLDKNMSLDEIIGLVREKG